MKKMYVAAASVALLSIYSIAAFAQAPAAAPAAAPAQGGAAAPGAAPRTPTPRPPGPGGAIAETPGQSIVNGVQTKTPNYVDAWAVQDVVDNLPTAPPARPKQPRKVLVLATPKGFAHSSIPITATVVTLLGQHTGAWTTDIIWDQKEFTAQKLAGYDVLFLDNTTGTFLDDPNDAAGTAARRAALLNFVRSGKGLAGTHAATDSYHQGINGLWPEFNKLIGGYFKYHWNYPTKITVKIDDPRSPINAGFEGKPFSVHEEVYTFAQDSFSRKNVHVLTSVDYSKMSAEDKAKEPAATKRTDGDYAISWIKKEGQGRVFYSSLGHAHPMFFNPAYLKQLIAGIQYAAGDLAADDSPSVR